MGLPQKTVLALECPAVQAPVGRLPEYTGMSPSEYITNGPDGALWFTESGGSQIGRASVSPSAIPVVSGRALALCGILLAVLGTWAMARRQTA